MTRKTFGEQYMETRGGPIHYEGQVVHCAHRLQVTSPESFEVRFIRASAEVRQALRVAVEHGTIEVNGESLQDVILWTDTAPPTVQLNVHPNDSDCRATIWNAWEDGGMQAWLGDCGMLIESISSGVRLRCSHGISAPDFEDLVVELSKLEP